MSRRTTTRLAVLGVVAVEPASGYAIRQSIEETIGHFWSESFGQIYPTLAALEGDGDIEIVGTGPRNSKIYAITDRGLTLLRDLLVEDFAQPGLRDETLLRLFFGRFLGVEGSIELLRESLTAATGLLDRLNGIRSAIEEEHADDEDRVFWLITVRSGELAARARIQWAAEAIALLEEAAA